MNFIATHGRLPLTSHERARASYKSDQPPLFYLLAALPASQVDPTGPPFLKRVSDTPRRQLIERTRHAWGIYNTADEQWPYRAEILRWQVGRGVAILFGIGTLLVTFLIARLVLHDDGLALSAVGVVAFMPRFVLTGAMLNYETTVAFFAALFLWTLLKIGIRNQELGIRNQELGVSDSYFLLSTSYCLLLGFFAGLAILTKLSAIILPVEAVIALWLIKREQGWSWAQWGRAVSLTVLACLLTISWWFGFVIYQFNTIAQDGWWAGILHPLIAADTSDATTNRLLSVLTSGQVGFSGAIEHLDAGPPWAWAMTFFRTFWVVGIEEHQPLGWPGLIIALLICAVAVMGLYRYFVGQVSYLSRNRQDACSTLRLLLLHLTLPLALPLVRYAMTFSLADTAQGRHVLFSAAPAFAILLIWGIGNFPQSKIQNLKSIIPFYLICWTLVQLWYMSWAYVPLLPVHTSELLVPHQLTQPLNKNITLLGYNTNINKNSMLQVDLFWQATGLSPLDYFSEVTLYNEANKVVGQWLSYAANGRYPTRAWDIGDTVQDTAWLPLMGLPAGHYTLKLNLRPVTLDYHEPLLKTPLTLTTLDLPESKIQKSEIQVWRNGVPFDLANPFNYRETILVTFAKISALSLQTYNRVFTPTQMMTQSALFIVGADWPTGDYRLQFTATTNSTAPMLKVLNRWPRQFVEPPIAHRMEANFANQVKLLGYDIGNKRAQAGGGIPLTLYWQGLDWLGYDYTIFAKPIAVNDQTAYGGRDRFPLEGYQTSYWAPGEIVTDPFGVPISPSAPAGIYQLHVGLYRQVGAQSVALPLVQHGQPLKVNSVTIGPIKIGTTPPGLTVKQAQPHYPLKQSFGDAPNLRLLGYDLPDCQGTSHCQLTLYWQCLAQLPLDYNTFVHLRDGNGQTIAQKDGPPLNGAYPTSLWEADEIIADTIIVPLPADLPTEYSLVVGMYDLATGARLVVAGSTDNSLSLGKVKVR